MVKVSYEQKPFRREVMRTYGAKVTPSPSEFTEVGKKILREHPGTTGSLGCAISEAVEAATNQEGYRYVIRKRSFPGAASSDRNRTGNQGALDKYDIVPDVIIGCAGGGSNLGGLISPVYGRSPQRRKELPVHCRGTRILPQPYQRKICIRFLRYRESMPAVQNVHTGKRLYPFRKPCRRPPLPRHELHPFPTLR